MHCLQLSPLADPDAAGTPDAHTGHTGWPDRRREESDLSAGRALFLFSLGYLEEIEQRGVPFLQNESIFIILPGTRLVVSWYSKTTVRLPCTCLREPLQENGQTSQGSFSAVLKPKIAIKITSNEYSSLGYCRRLE